MVEALFLTFNLIVLMGSCRLPSLQTKEAQSLPMTVQPILSKEEKVTGVEPQNVVSLAGKAFSASREAALIAESTKLLGVNLDDSHNPR